MDGCPSQPGAAAYGGRLSKSPPLRTPDGRYIIVRGRLWRASNPDLTAAARAELVRRLALARRAVRDALRSGNPEALASARAAVDAAKHGLGERGPVWWTDGTPDFNRRMVKTSPYAEWYSGASQRPPGTAG